MAVVMVSGVPGAGKTYHVVRTALLEALREGRRVVTSIRVKPVDIAAYLKRYSVALEVVDASDLRRPEIYPDVTPAGAVTPGTILKGGELLIVDEVYATWPPGRAVANRLPDRLVRFLRMHRHCRDPVTGRPTDIIVIGQGPDDPHDELDPLVERHDLVTNLGGITGQNRYKVASYRRRSTADAALMSTRYYHYDKAIYQLYNSYAQSVSGTAAVIAPRRSVAGKISFGVAMASLGILAVLVMGYGAFRKASSQLRGDSPLATVGQPVPPIGAPGDPAFRPPVAQGEAASAMPSAGASARMDPDLVDFIDRKIAERLAQSDPKSGWTVDELRRIPVSTAWRAHREHAGQWIRASGRIYDVERQRWRGSGLPSIEMRSLVDFLDAGFELVPIGPCGGSTLVAPDRRSRVQVPGPECDWGRPVAGTPRDARGVRPGDRSTPGESTPVPTPGESTPVPPAPDGVSPAPAAVVDAALRRSR